MDSDLMIGIIEGKMGRGLVVGVVGTVATTVSQVIEMQMSRREASTAPAEAASQVFDVYDVLQKANEEQKQPLAQTVHWSYGTVWGSVRAVLNLLGIESAPAIILQFAALWGIAISLLPRLESSKPVTTWKPEEVAVSAFHHVVYIAVANLA